MVRILLCDDHPEVMEGTKILLEQAGDMEVILAHSELEALEMAIRQHFDVMLFDLNMPDVNGIELAKQVLILKPGANILIYTGHDFKNRINLMVKTGISGFISKTANKEKLVTAVRCALQGEVILPLSWVKQLRKNSLRMTDSTEGIETQQFSETELKILQRISNGNSNKEIADGLIMSQRSLEYDLINLFEKLNVNSRLEAVMKAKKIGLIIDPRNLQ